MQDNETGYRWAGSSLFSDAKDFLDRFAAVLETSYDGIYITDGQANTIIVNKSYENITGLRREDVLGKNMQELVDCGVIDESGTLLALEKKDTITIEQKFRTGKRAVITSTPTFNEEGEITMVVTNVRDITEIHNLRKRLSQQEELSKKQLQELDIIRKQLIGAGEITVVDQAMLKIMLHAKTVAKLDTIVLLLGETGVGKEKIATYIHQISGRNSHNLIKVNCGAIPQHLIESELFGYERGAFTGADKNGKLGLFEVADKGSIFLDEVGDLPLDMQVKLLRVIQEQEIQRIGATKPRKIDVRIMAATNRDLKEMVAEGAFRKDLYYRLSVFPLLIPPLRERPDDILPLAQSALKELNERHGMHKELSQSAAMELQGYHWPGNVRELRNIIERAMILSPDVTIHPQDLSITSGHIVLSSRISDGQVNLKRVLEEVESGYIRQAYETHRNIRRAARCLSMDTTTYARKKKKYMD